MNWTKLNWNFIDEIALGVMFGLFLHEWVSAIIAGLAQIDWVEVLFKVARQLIRGTETAVVICVGVAGALGLVALLGDRLNNPTWLKVGIALFMIVALGIPTAWWFWRGKQLYDRRSGQ